MSLPPRSVARAAELLARSRLSPQLFDRLPDDARPQDEDGAYVIQAAVHELLTAAGRGAVVGHKIGCTTPVMQAYLGIENPCAGGVFGPTVSELSGVHASPTAGRLGVECEIAVVLDTDLPPREGGYSRQAVADAVGACMCAIEIVEDRYLDYPSLDTPTLIADDFFNAGAVFGVRRPDFPAGVLASVSARMLINGEEVGEGVGSDVLGDPLDALAWLASRSRQAGVGLVAGEFVLLGSLVQTNWIGPGDEVVIENEPLGCARLDIPEAQREPASVEEPRAST